MALGDVFMAELRANCEPGSTEGAQWRTEGIGGRDVTACNAMILSLLAVDMTRGAMLAASGYRPEGRALSVAWPSLLRLRASRSKGPGIGPGRGENFFSGDAEHRLQDTHRGRS
jgi:hypothetical protein